jgi:uncharacterized protein YegP (UPF0339 family)
MAAKFVVYQDKAKKFRFRLLATNGEIIATGEAYESKASCQKGIDSIKKNAATAVIVDETVKKEPAKTAAAKATTAAKKPAAKASTAKKPAEKKAAPKKAAPKA